MIADRQLTIIPRCTIEFGAGALGRLPSAIAAQGHRRAFIVTDRGVRGAGAVGDAVDILSAAGVETMVYDEVEPNPSAAIIDFGAERLRAFGDAVVVPVGGGSSIDSAKGISLVAINGGSAPDFDYRNEPAKPGLPLVAVPTTAGTGAETNAFGVIEDIEQHRKFYIGHASVQPVVAILDPVLTMGLPPGPTAATGVDALTHALESISSRNVNPYAEGLALQAIGMISAWLPRAVSTGSDLEARAQLLLASHLAGLAFASGTGLGMCHAIAHAVSAHLGAAHGVALSTVLPHVLEFNRTACQARYARVAFALGVGDSGAGEEANACAAIAAVRKLAEQVGTAVTLGGLGCTEELVPVLVDAALADEVMANTPRTPSATELNDLLVAAL